MGIDLAEESFNENRSALPGTSFGKEGNPRKKKGLRTEVKATTIWRKKVGRLRRTNRICEIYLS